MKSHILKISALAAVAATCTIPASAAVSDTVGYITINIAGNTSGNPSGAATFIAPTLIEDNVFVGTSTNTPAGSSTLTFTSGVPTVLDGTYLLEITSGEYEGWWTAVDSSTSTTITTTASLPADFLGQASVAVRKFTTLASFLGDNSIGIEAYDGVKTDYDEIQVLDPLEQSVQSAIYVDINGVPAGWYNGATFADLNSLPIYPGTAVKVIRRKATPIAFTTTGSVKTTKTMIAVSPSYNWVGQSLAIGDDFAGIELVDQIDLFDGVKTDYDSIELINTDQSTTSYFGLDPSLNFGKMMVNAVTFVDAEATEVPEGAGFIFHRKSALGGTTLIIPAQTIGASN